MSPNLAEADDYQQDEEMPDAMRTLSLSSMISERSKARGRMIEGIKTDNIPKKQGKEDGGCCAIF